jgi:hypothetical protein
MEGLSLCAGPNHNQANGVLIMTADTLGVKNANVTLAALRINGTSPFHSPPDSMAERLNEAHALLLVLANGHDCAEAAGGNAADEFGALRHQITSAALHGIATLVALAMHHNDVVDAERAARHDK